MTETLDTALKTLFDKASLHHAARQLPQTQEWARINQVVTRYHVLQNKLQTRQAASYKREVSQELMRLIDKAGSKEMRLIPKLFGIDRFGKEALTRQAQHNVQRAHHQACQTLSRRENRELQSALSAATSRARQAGIPTQAFQEATDRRAGVERRQAHHRAPRRGRP